MPSCGPSVRFRFTRLSEPALHPLLRAERCGAGTPACAPPKAATESSLAHERRRFAPRADRSVCATLHCFFQFSIFNFQFGAAVLLCLIAALPAAAAEPQRIVTLVPSAAEVLDGLGLADRIVGVTDYTDFPAGMEALPKVGAFNNLNIEATVALRPDLAVATSDGNSPAVIARLRRLGIDVVVLDLRYWETTQGSILDLGKQTGREREAKELVAEMNRVAGCVSAATKGAKRPRVLFAFDMNPVIAPGQDSFTNQLIGMAGGESVTKGNSAPYPRLSAEGLIALAPEVIVVSTMNPAKDLDAWKEWLGRWPAIPAVKSGAIRMIDSRTIDRPSHRLVIGLRELAANLHPELFTKGVCEPKWRSAAK